MEEVNVRADTTGRVEAITQPASTRFLDACRRNQETCARLMRGLETDAEKVSNSIPPEWRRVLIVDDDPALIRAFQRVLRDIVEVVDEAPSVAVALSKVERFAYDVLIVDYFLTNGTALDVVSGARWVNKKQRREEPYTILVSAYPDELRRGVDVVKPDAYFDKPISAETLQDAVNAAFSRSERTHAQRRDDPRQRHTPLFPKGRKK